MRVTALALSSLGIATAGPCESCISAPFMAWCFPQQSCYASGKIACDLSQCASGSMMIPGCDCHQCTSSSGACGAPIPGPPGPPPPPKPPQCKQRVKFPSGHYPTLQAQRPPQQTAVQASVRASNVKDAASLSAAATPKVMSLLDATRASGKLKGLWCENSTSDELLAVLQWEYMHQSILHNGPLKRGTTPDINDDTDMVTTLSNGYMQNVIQRYVLGVEHTGNAMGEGGIMESYMGYPPFAHPTQPTLREANDRVFYLATNWQKVNAGNFEYGSVTYVVNHLYADKFFIAAGDSGAYSSKMPRQFGTLQDWLHLLPVHLSIYGYDLGQLFQRWYGGAKKMDINLLYFEIEWSGNCWLPESLLYIVPKFSELWGTSIGLQLQNWMYQNRRPLVWADGDDSGMIVDPVVGQVALAITPAMSDAFKALWAKLPCKGQETTELDDCLTFAQLLAATDKLLQLSLMDYRQRAICAPFETPGSVEQVMGTNALGQCVYWVYEQPPFRYECLNDGTCAQSLGGRGTFSTKDDCEQNCGRGKWACMQNANLPGCAGDKATMCVPSPQGYCSNVTDCERWCTATDTRAWVEEISGRTMSSGNRLG